MDNLWMIETKERRLKWLRAAEAVEVSFKRFVEAFKFDQNQPRLPAGQAGGGQRTSDDENQSKEAQDIQEILASARFLAASRASMNKCIDLCYPILERFQSPRSNQNEFDFRKCLNLCLGIQ